MAGAKGDQSAKMLLNSFPMSYTSFHAYQLNMSDSVSPPSQHIVLSSVYI